MKKLISLMLMMTFIAFSCAQGTKENVPETVKSAFSKKFPTITKVKWEKEKEGEWEGSFKMEKKEYSANFAEDGTWLETEFEISKKDIPALVKQTLDSQFSEYSIEESEQSETSHGIAYEFELEKGDIELEVAIDASGKVIEQKAESEESEENE